LGYKNGCPVTCPQNLKLNSESFRMKKTFVVALIFINSICSAQDKFFQIIAFKGNVLVDSLPVTCGQKIDASSQLMLIEKDGYAAVLTSQGYAFQLGRGKHKVKSILAQTHSNLIRVKDSRGVGAVHRPYADPIKILSVDEFHEYAYLGGDTLTIVWQAQTGISTYSVILTDMLDKILVDTTVFGNTVTIPVPNIFKDKALLFQVKAGKLSSKQMFVKASQDYKDFRFDASCASGMSLIERELLLAGLCEVYNLYYDQIHHLHNLYVYSKKTGIEILHPYYQRMLKEHDFEIFFVSQP